MFAELVRHARAWFAGRPVSPAQAQDGQALVCASGVVGFGTVTVPGGGTGRTSLSSHAVLVGAGSAALTQLAAATDGQLLIGQTGADPAWAAASGDVTVSAAGVTAIGSARVTNAMLAGSIASAKLVGTDVVTVGTLTAGATGAGFTIALTTSTVTGTLTETHGGTAQTSYATGDVLYASAANTLARLAGNATTTRKFLRQTGSGSASAAPAWDTIAAADVPAFVAAGGSHAAGAVPDPGSTSHSNAPYVLGDAAAWLKPNGKVLAYSYVSTDQTTTSATPVDLTTAQSVTFTLDEAVTVFVVGWANFYSATASVGEIDADVDGSDTLLSSATSSGGNAAAQLAGVQAVALTAGSHVVKLQFATTAGTGHFRARMMMVVYYG